MFWTCKENWHYDGNLVNGVIKHLKSTLEVFSKSVH